MSISEKKAEGWGYPEKKKETPGKSGRQKMRTNLRAVNEEMWWGGAFVGSECWWDQEKIRRGRELYGKNKAARASRFGVSKKESAEKVEKKKKSPLETSLGPRTGLLKEKKVKPRQQGVGTPKAGGRRTKRARKKVGPLGP